MISQILSETSKCFSSRSFQTVFGSNVLWSGLVTLWRNCALSSFHNFECVYCSKKREGSLEAAAPRERERESVYSTEDHTTSCVLLWSHHYNSSVHQSQKLQQHTRGQQQGRPIVPSYCRFNEFFLENHHCQTISNYWTIFWINISWIIL